MNHAFSIWASKKFIEVRELFEVLPNVKFVSGAPHDYDFMSTLFIISGGEKTEKMKPKSTGFQLVGCLTIAFIVIRHAATFLRSAPRWTQNVRQLDTSSAGVLRGCINIYRRNSCYSTELGRRTLRDVRG